MCHVSLFNHCSAVILFLIHYFPIDILVVVLYDMMMMKSLPSPPPSFSSFVENVVGHMVDGTWITNKASALASRRMGRSGMSTSIKIPTAGLEKGESGSFEGDQADLHGLDQSEHDGIDKLFAMLSGSMHSVFGDDILLVKILKSIIARLSNKRGHRDENNSDQKNVAHIKCMVRHGLSDILVQVLRWSFELLSNKKLQVENRVRFEVCHMSIEHALYIYYIVAEYFFPHRSFEQLQEIIEITFDVLINKVKVFKNHKQTQLRALCLNSYLLKHSKFRKGMIGYFQENNGINGYMAYLKKYNNDSDMAIQILFSLSSLLKQNVAVKLSVIKENGVDSILDCLDPSAHQYVIYNASFCLLYLVRNCYDGIEQVCDYESAEDYSFTKVCLHLMSMYKNNSAVHRAIQKNFITIFITLSKTRKSKDILKTALKEGVIKKLIFTLRSFPDSIEIKKLCCWLLSVFILFTQNKIFKDVDSDFDSDDEINDGELPVSVLTQQEEQLLYDQVKRNSTPKLIDQMIKFIEVTEEKIRKEKEEIKAAEEKLAELRMKANVPNPNGIDDAGNNVDGEDHDLDILNGDIETVNIPEQKTFLDEQFVDCVYKLKDALDWFENYLEMMDKARKAMEKFAMEQAELASNADKVSATSGRRKK